MGNYRINIDWDYKNRTCDISIPNFTKNKLKEFDFKSKKVQHLPYPEPTKSLNTQKPVLVDKAKQLSPERVKRIQKIIRSFLYLSRAVDLTTTKALSSLSSQQSKATVKTEELIQHFLEYCNAHPDPKIRFHASNMILAIHSDASFMNEPMARSTAAGFFWLKNKDDKDKKMKLNGAVQVILQIIKLVCASTAESELAAIFINAREAIKLKRTLEAMGHKQPPVNIVTDNETAEGIAKQTIR